MTLIELGRREGVLQGMEQARQLGIEQGRSLVLHQYVKSMVKHGLPLSKVSAITGLAEDEIQVLLTEHQPA